MHQICKYCGFEYDDSYMFKQEMILPGRCDHILYAYGLMQKGHGIYHGENDPKKMLNARLNP